jgi:RNA polymerase sigma-70 factor (ECF subfamily)
LTRKSNALCDAISAIYDEPAMDSSSEPKSAGQFSTTHWSVVLLAGKPISQGSAAALEKLCRAYWQPIYFFARRKGRSEADAKDLTQQFFARLLERNDFQGLDPAKGKFRTFLLTAFTHFMANEHDRATALKRGGGQIILSLEDLPSDDVSAEAISPAEIYDRHWANNILQAALKSLKQQMSDAGKEFQYHELKCFLTAHGDTSAYAVAAKNLGVETSSVPVLVHRLRHHYRELVRAEVAQTVTSPGELDEEMRHLFALVNR